MISALLSIVCVAVGGVARTWLFSCFKKRAVVVFLSAVKTECYFRGVSALLRKCMWLVVALFVA